MKIQKNYFFKENWLFLCIFLIQLFAIIFTFGFFKQGFHSDELFEYGFANSYDLRVLDTDDLGNGLDRTWTDSKELWKYITVEDNHRFSYSNIYKHASMDYYNPPFKLFLLHTICSFFPGKFSIWYSFIINIFSFIVIQFSMYFLLKKMLKSKAASIAGIVLFGFSAGCFSAMEFLRMYALGMAFGLLFLYFSFCLLNREAKNKILFYAFVFGSLFLGAFTLHLFLVYAFPIAVVFCFGFLFTKRIKEMFAYGLTCLFSVVVSLLAFPSTFFNTLPTNETLSYASLSYSQGLQYRIYWYFTTLDNFGFHTSVYSNPWIKISLAILLFLAILFTPLFLLLRKEQWFKTFLNKIFIRLKNLFKKMNYSSVVMISCACSICFVIYICSTRTSVNVMGIHFASRYVFMIYPLVSILSVSFVYYLLMFIIPKLRVVSFITVILAFVISSYSQLITSQSYLLMHEEEGVTLHDLEDNANCLITLSTNWLIMLFAPDISNTNSYYFVDYNNMKSTRDCLKDINHDDPLYLIMDCSIVLNREEMKIYEEDKESNLAIFLNNKAILDEDIFDYYTSLDGVSKIELVGKDEIFTRPVKIYRVYFED